MKRIYTQVPLLFVLLILVFVPLDTSGQGWGWMKGGQNGETSGIVAATDFNGNVYGAGDFYGTGHFGPYNFGASGSNQGLGGTLLVKYDSSGNIRWLITSNNGSGPEGLSTDLFGNEYLMGVYYDTISFGGHTLIAPSKDTQYYFIAKIDSGGNVKWIKSIGNVQQLGDYGVNNIATDNNGNIYITCSASSNTTIGSFSINNIRPYSQAIVVAKYDSSGSVIWVKSFGGEGPDFPAGIIVMQSGNIYISGC